MTNYKENKNQQSKEQNCCERICRLYGICGLENACMNSHQVSLFGIQQLNENKS